METKIEYKFCLWVSRLQVAFAIRSRQVWKLRDLTVVISIDMPVCLWVRNESKSSQVRIPAVGAISKTHWEPKKKLWQAHLIKISESLHPANEEIILILDELNIAAKAGDSFEPIASKKNQNKLISSLTEAAFAVFWTPIKLAQKRGRPHSTIDSVLALQPVAPGLNPGIPKVFSETNCLDVNCCQVNRQHCCLEQWTAEA